MIQKNKMNPRLELVHGVQHNLSILGCEKMMKLSEKKKYCEVALSSKLWNNEKLFEGKCPYLVHLIVGQLDLLEADDLLAELVRGERRVRVRIVAVRRRRITLASHQPTGSVIRISEDRRRTCS